MARRSLKNRVCRGRRRVRASALGACLSIPREPRWLCKGADARRAALGVVDSTPKPRNAADAPCRANPQGPGGFAFTHRCYMDASRCARSLQCDERQIRLQVLYPACFAGQSLRALMDFADPRLISPESSKL